MLRCAVCASSREQEREREARAANSISRARPRRERLLLFSGLLMAANLLVAARYRPLGERASLCFFSLSLALSFAFFARAPAVHGLIHARRRRGGEARVYRCTVLTSYSLMRGRNYRTLAAGVISERCALVVFSSAPGCFIGAIWSFYELRDWSCLRCLRGALECCGYSVAWG